MSSRSKSKMKFIEPISSSVLLTACAYAAGISHNNAFMRTFGVDPEFSQPSIEKALYDGGVITFEELYNHCAAVLEIAKSNTSIAIISATIAILTGLLIYFRRRLPQIADKLKAASLILGSYTPIGLAGLTYIMFLTFSSFNRAEEKGENLALKFIKNCQWIEMHKEGETEKACAFKKDNDSIWYFTLETAGSKANAKNLSELDSITYLKPEKLID